MALIALKYPEYIIDNVLDFLVGPVDYYKSMFQLTLNELLDNQIGREAKVEQLSKFLNDQPLDTLLAATQRDYIEYDRYGIYRVQSYTCFTTFILKWNYSKYYGPDKIRISKHTFDAPWTFTTVRYKVLTPEQIEANRINGITWKPLESISNLSMDELLQELFRANESYQARIQL